MNIQEFNAPLPKPWLNIKANSIESNISSTGQENSVQQIGLGSVIIDNSAGPRTLVASEVVSGILSHFNLLGGAYSLTFPSASSLTASINPSLLIPLTFTFYISNRSTQNITLTLGAGCQFSNGPGIGNVPANSTMTLTFYGNGSSYTVFF